MSVQRTGTTNKGEPSNFCPLGGGGGGNFFRRVASDASVEVALSSVYQRYLLVNVELHRKVEVWFVPRMQNQESQIGHLSVPQPKVSASSSKFTDFLVFRRINCSFSGYHLEPYLLTNYCGIVECILVAR